MSHVLWLDGCTEACADRVGGKAVGLGSLLREGFRVPPGFAVTTDAYRRCVASWGVGEEVARALQGADGVEAQAAASRRIRRRFEEAALSGEVAEEVARAYGRLCQDAGEPLPVAVRSSATAEDAAEASFAGQQETYLWVRGAEEVARHVVRCWGSLFTPQAISYRARLGIPPDELAMAVVVQQMVAAEAAGVMITIDPVTGDPSQICIEASFGLGVAVVGGEVTPDRYFVDKVTLEVRRQEVAPKAIAYRFDPGAGAVRALPVPPGERAVPALAPEEVVAVAALGKRVERALGRAQDIEWAVGPGPGGPREVFLLQARPETVWSRRARAPISDPTRSVLDRMVDSMRRPMRLAGGPPGGLGT